jgi:deoxyribose-phosphate aldolase
MERETNPGMDRQKTLKRDRASGAQGTGAERMSEPATGEWTVYSVMKLRQKHWHEEDKNNAIAIAHNAAIATAKTATGMETELPTEIHVKIDPSLLPKPATGEWTVETIAVIRGRDGDFGLAAAINAAIAAEKEEVLKVMAENTELCEENHTLKQGK